MTTGFKKYYLSKFKGKTFVLKIGGEVVDSKVILENILKEIKELFDFGIKIILVHGGGVQADVVAEKFGHTPKKINGRRVTTEVDLEIAKMLYGGSLNLEILSILKVLGLPGIRVSGLDGNLFEADMRSKKKVDYGYVGDIKSVNSKVLFDVMENGYLPIVSPLAVSDDGVILNINADTVAMEIAKSVKAEKLVLFTNTDGVSNGKKLLSTLTTVEAEDLIATGVIKDGMAVKIESCVKAIDAGIARVHILNGLSPDSLLKEIFSKKGVGTMIVSSKEKSTYLNEA